MAKNIKFRLGDGSPVVPPASAFTYPTTPASGDPVIIAGTIPGIAIKAEDSDLECTAEIGALFR
jgi:hypothetical protein